MTPHNDKAAASDTPVFIILAEEYAGERQTCVTIHDVLQSEVPEDYLKRSSFDDGSLLYRKDIIIDDGEPVGYVTLLTKPPQPKE